MNNGVETFHSFKRYRTGGQTVSIKMCNSKNCRFFASCFSDYRGCFVGCSLKFQSPLVGASRVRLQLACMPNPLEFSQSFDNKIQADGSSPRFTPNPSCS